MPERQNSSADDQILKISGPRLGPVGEIVGYLKDMEHVYNNIYVFISLVSEAQEDQMANRSMSSVPKFNAIPKTRVDSFVLPEAKLQLRRAEFHSPGFWEFLGSLNVLDVIRKWLNDRDERRKDRNYRETYDAERLRLENEKLKTTIVRDQIEILERVGVPQDKIRAALARHIIGPLGLLEQHQDSGLIGGSK